MSVRLILGAALALSSGACSTDTSFTEPELSWERMDLQRRANAYDRSAVFADGKVMQSPPPGAVPHDSGARGEAVESGTVGGVAVEHIPIDVDAALIRRGAARFDIFCAVCHGVVGDGVSMVAAKMSLRRPPSLLDARYRSYPSGQLFRVITDGYGLMPPYSGQLTIDERWAVVAYIRALQLSQGVPVARLPDDLRRSLDEATR